MSAASFSSSATLTLAERTLRVYFAPPAAADQFALHNVQETYTWSEIGAMRKAFRLRQRKCGGVSEESGQ